MKAVGIILVGMGIALLAFTIISFFGQSKQVVSPIPESDSVKVILVLSPTPITK